MLSDGYFAQSFHSCLTDLLVPYVAGSRQFEVVEEFESCQQLDFIGRPLAGSPDPAGGAQSLRQPTLLSPG